VRQAPIFPDRGQQPSDCRDRCRGLVVGDKEDCPNLRTACSRDRISLDVINIGSATRTAVLTSRGANDNLGLRRRSLDENAGA
jgi:hypothetical protein